MFSFDKTDTQRFMVSGIGAVAMTLASLTLATAPAKAAAINPPATIGDWQAEVSRQLDAAEDLTSLNAADAPRQVTLASSFTAEGDYGGSQVVRSSGNMALDRHAMEVAGKVAYPALPAGYRGRPQTVTVKLFFGRGAVQAADADTARAKGVRTASNAGAAGIRIAAR